MQGMFGNKQGDKLVTSIQVHSFVKLLATTRHIVSFQETLW